VNTRPDGATISLSRSKRIARLDGVRAVAVSLVVLLHVSLNMHLFKEGSLPDLFASTIGLLGVNVFFVLSGYLITTLLLKERARTGTVDVRAFYGRRIARIFPPFYAYLAVVALLSIFGHLAVPTFADFAIDAAYLRNVFGFLGQHWYTGHSWTLDMEEQFYLVWPLVMLGGALLSKRFAILAFVLEPVVRIAFYFAFPHARESMSIQILTHADFLMLGCVAAIALPANPKALPFFQHSALRALAPVALLLYFANIFPSRRFHGIWDFTIGYSLQAALLAIVLVPIFVAKAGSPYDRFFSLPALVWLGRISYSVYLWQQLFIVPFRGSILQVFPIDVFCAIAAGAASYYFIERRFARASA